MTVSLSIVRSEAAASEMEGSDGTTLHESREWMWEQDG